MTHCGSNVFETNPISSVAERSYFNQQRAVCERIINLINPLRQNNLSELEIINNVHRCLTTWF